MTETVERARLGAPHRAGDYFEMVGNLGGILRPLHGQKRRRDIGQSRLDAPAVRRTPGARHRSSSRADADRDRRDTAPAIAAARRLAVPPSSWSRSLAGRRIDDHMGGHGHQCADPLRLPGAMDKRDRAAVAVADEDALRRSSPHRGPGTDAPPHLP